MASQHDRLVPIAILAAAVINAGLTWFWYGGLGGLDVATRTSARFSSCVFAVALATRLGPGAMAWMRGFVSAHLIHYVTLLQQAIVDVQAHLHAFSVVDSVSVIAGVLLLVPLAITSREPWRGKRWLNSSVVALVWGTFAGGAAVNAARYRMALLPVMPLLVALAIHTYRLRAQRVARNALAGVQPAS